MPTDEGKVVRLEILRRPCGSEEPACWRVFPPTARPKLVAGSSVLLLAQRDIHGTALTGGLLVGLTLATTTEQSRT
jgi:hypothetical protein